MNLHLDIRYSIRMLLKRPGFTAVALITLAVGIGANTAIFSSVNAVLLRPLPYANQERIMRVDETEGRGGMGISPPNLLDFQQQNHSFESIAGYTGGSFVLTGGAEPVRVQSLDTSTNLLSVLGVDPLIGRTFSDDDLTGGQSRVVLISFGFWQRHFGGDRNLVGRQITLDGKSYSVIGVMPPDFEFPIQEEKVEMWAPLDFPGNITQMRGAHYLDAVGRLKSNVTPQQAVADLDSIAERIAKQYPDLVPGKTTVVPLKQDLVGGIQRYMLMLGGAVFLVFLIVAANVTSLFLARAAERQKEIAVRMAMGATRLRLLRQLLTEGLLLSLLGGAAGLVLAMWTTNFLLAISPGDLPRLQSARIDWSVLLFVLAVSLICGCLLALVPALRSPSPDLNSTLKEGGVRSTLLPRQSLRKGLVVVEITLAFVLLTGAGLLIRTLWKLNSVNPGFEPQGLMVAEVVLPKTRYPDEAGRTAYFQELIERIQRLPGVESAGGTSNLPLSGSNMVFLATVEGSEIAPFPAGFRSITAEYLGTMRIPLLRGRWFTTSDSTSSQSVVLVNETMARKISSDGNALGKRIKHGFKQRVAEVVGIVGDVKYAGLDKPTKPEMYAPFSQQPWPFMRIAVRTKSEPAAFAAALRREAQAIDKDQPIDKISTMSSVVNDSIQARRFYMQVLAVFALIAFVLAAAGIYGVVAYSVVQRRREIGIRIALGATRRDVIRLVLGESVLITIAGVGLGVAGAFAATRVLTTLLFEVTPTDPLTLALLSLLLGAVAIIAAYVPARRATKVDPLVALRYE
ncbi:MAG TPA: ABC transporter permease [Pyrinomonadaceae bacterium]|jgi:putative ABC transport system permease protein